MKKNDLFFIFGAILFFSPFFIFENVYLFYNNMNNTHGMLMSFVKFGILATMGESIGLRISAGVYNRPGFGILPKAVVWGFLGLAIKTAFVIFSAGTDKFLVYMGMPLTPEIMQGGMSGIKLAVAFARSTAMNLVFGIILMTLHKITDEHITQNGGKLSALLKPINFAGILTDLNWQVMWNFVYKKTLPFFWIPAHTITFLLPEQFQVLFAALLGIALGVILATASAKARAKTV